MTSERKGSRASAKTVLIVSDTHFPFVTPAAWKFLEETKRRFKPTMIVHIGDVVDAHVLSRFVRESNSMGALDELHAAQRDITRLGKLFPVMKLCHGNHDLRHLKKANEVGIPGEYFKSFGEIIGAPPGWTFADSFEIGGVHFCHGDNFTGQGATVNLIKHRMTNVVHGHTHAAQVVYFNGRFGLNVGCLIDRAQYAFAYAKHAKTDPWLGCGLIENGVPRLVPLAA